MKKRIIFVILAFLLTFGSKRAKADILLYDWAVNDNGSVYSYFGNNNSPGDLPAYFNSSGFDWNTGLGNITITYTGSGNYSLISFFDNEIIRQANTYFNEYGEVHGTPGTGQSWEIDEPVVFGDIYYHVLDGVLDNNNALPFGFEDDVSMAMGWDFSLKANEIALISLTISESTPSGFYLAQHDPDGVLYFTGDLTIQSSISSVPEPATILLLGVGLTCLAGRRRLIKTNQ